MSQHYQPIEAAIAQLPTESQYLVRDCAHQVQQLLDRYQKPHLQSLVIELVSAQQQESIKY